MSSPLLFEAARALREGGTVVFPTETVYGLGANALDGRAAAQVFEIKRRPRFNPLIVHVPDTTQAERLSARFPAIARRLADAFWPGPLTLVVPRAKEVPDIITAGLPSVALRVPGHPLALELLQAAGVPIAAPSANRFGTLSPTRAEDLAPEIRQRVSVVLDGGPCKVGVESTILGIEGDELVLLRPGGLPLEEIAEVAGQAPRVPSSTGRPLAPGMLAKHYSPRTRLVHGDTALIRGKRVGLLCLTPPEDVSAYAMVEALSPSGSLTEAAAGLFQALRRMDEAGLDLILALEFPAHGLGVAINDRLRRASC